MKLSENISIFLKSSGDMHKRFVPFCALVGVVAGLLAVGFRLAIEFLCCRAWNFVGALGEGNRFWIMPIIPEVG